MKKMEDEIRKYMRMLRKGANDKELLGEYCKIYLMEKVWHFMHSQESWEHLSNEATTNHLIQFGIPKENIVQNGYTLIITLPNSNLCFDRNYGRTRIRYVEPFFTTIDLGYCYSSQKIAEFMIRADKLIPQLTSDFEIIRKAIEQKTGKSIETIRIYAQKINKTHTISANTIETCVNAKLSSLGDIKYVHFKEYSRIYLNFEDKILQNLMKSAIGLTRGNLHINAKKQLEITFTHKELADQIKTICDDIDRFLATIRNRDFAIYGNGKRCRF